MTTHKPLVNISHKRIRPIARVLLLAAFVLSSTMLEAKQSQQNHNFKHKLSANKHKPPMVGFASFYATKFNNRRTANGEKFNNNAFTAAHKSLPFGTKLKVTNLRNGSSVMVRVNDRGPYIKGRIIDLSKAAAKKIGLNHSGTAHVKLEVLNH